MARPLRIDLPDAIHHVLARGVGRMDVYRDARDRERFLEILARVVARYGWLCEAYCLMGNHYHLLIETPKPTLRAGMRQLNGIYAQWFNARHDRTGHVFGGRYKAVAMERDPHLLEVARYIVLNPVRAGLCADPAAWPWSSYAATAGLAPAPSFLAVDRLLSLYGTTRADAQRQYHAFVDDGVERSPWGGVRGEIYLGSEAFAQSQAARVPAGPPIPRPQRVPVRRPLAEILARGTAEEIHDARRTYGYLVREIAEHLGIHPSTLRRRLRDDRSSGRALLDFKT